jgi:hypothetical protein
MEATNKRQHPFTYGSPPGRRCREKKETESTDKLDTFTDDDRATAVDRNFYSHELREYVV